MKTRLLINITIGILYTGSIIAQVGKDSTKAISARTEIAVKPLEMQAVKTRDNLTWHSMITNVPHDISEFPASVFKSNKVPLIAVLAAGTGALMIIDQQGWQANRRLFRHSTAFHNLSDLGVSLGNEKYHFIVAGALGAFGLISGDSRSLKTASNLVEVIIASGVTVQLLKRVFGRESPAVATETGGEWTFFPNLKEYQKHQPKYYAYPSGHLTTLTAAVTVIANNYPEAKWIKPVGYSLIGICGLGLVSRGMHWYSDLPIGFFLGYTFGNLISPQKETPASAKPSVSNAHFTPLIGFDNLGVQFSLNF